MRIADNAIKVELCDLIANFFPRGQKPGMNEKLIFHAFIWNSREGEVSTPVLFPVRALKVQCAVNQFVLRRPFGCPTAGVARVK